MLNALDVCMLVAYEAKKKAKDKSFNKNCTEMLEKRLERNYVDE